MVRFVALAIALPAALFVIGCDFENDPLKNVIDTPVVSSPSDGATIGMPVVVTGSGIPGAAVTVSVTRKQIEIGATTVTADAEGNFSANVSFSEQDQNTVLLVCVTQTNDDGNSPVAVVTVMRGPPN